RDFHVTGVQTCALPICGLNYGSSGTGGNTHFSTALFAAAAGIDMTHVPFKGISLAVTALASGEIEVLVSSQAALMPQIQAKRVRSEERRGGDARTSCWP